MFSEWTDNGHDNSDIKSYLSYGYTKVRGYYIYPRT